MGLDEFKQESDGSTTSSIKTRKQIDNVTMSTDFWDNLIATEPGWAFQAALQADGNGDKAIIQRMDHVLENGAYGIKISDEKREEIQNQRDEFVELHLED